MMVDSYIGEVRLFAFGRAPEGWAQCNGQLLSIAQYTALFTLLGTTYGGDGVNTFGVPDLRSRVPVGQGQLAGGSTYPVGMKAGTEGVSLLTANVPSHSHGVVVSKDQATQTVPGPGLVYGNVGTGNVLYTTPGSMPNPVQMGNTPQQTIANNVGANSQPHSNVQASIGMQYCISLFGIYPQPN